MRLIKTILFTIISALIFSLWTCAVTAPEIFSDAAIRTEEPLGLRVKAVISSEDASDKDTYEYGFLVTRKVFLSGNKLTSYDLTLECKAYFDKGVAKGIVNGEDVNKFYDKNDTELYFAGHFYGISPRYYTDTIVARPYIISEMGTFYGEPFEMSLYDTAKRIYADKSMYEELSELDKEAILSIIVAVEGEPYYIDRNDFRIVLSSSVVKNSNPTYSVVYDLYNPFTGETLLGVKGRKASKNSDEISAMVQPFGTIVPMYDGIVQDTTEGYASGNIEEALPVWIASFGLDSELLSVCECDEMLSCKDCVHEYIARNSHDVSASLSTPVSVFENLSFTISSMTKLSEKDTSLLCYNTVDGKTAYSDYVKAYVSVDENGMCEYIIAIVNDGENSALDEKCLKHSSFDIDFYVDGKIYDTKNVLYNSSADLPIPPEKDGYIFEGWSDRENGDIIDVSNIPVTENVQYYAVFREIKKYTVTFYVENEAISSQTVREGTFAFVPDNPEIADAKFVGWATEKDSDTTSVVDISTFVIQGNTDFYAVFMTNPNSPEFMEKLNRGHTQLQSIKRITGKAKTALTTIKDTIALVLNEANNYNYIDRDYVTRVHGDKVDEVKKIVNEEMTKSERSQFVNLITSTVDKDVQDFLTDYFGISMDKI